MLLIYNFNFKFCLINLVYFSETPVNARVIAAQSFEILCVHILRQPCWHEENAHRLIFRHDTTENSPTSMTHNLLSDVPNDFEFGTIYLSTGSGPYRKVLSPKSHGTD